MKIKLKNIDLKPATDLLSGLQLKGQQSRDRTKLVHLLQPAQKEVEDARYELIKEYCLKDDKDELVVRDNKYVPLNKPAYDAQVLTLFEETVELDTGTYTENIKRAFEALKDLDVPLSGAEAEVYDKLMDEYESEEN